MTDLKWLVKLLSPYVYRLALAVLLGYLAIAANVGLMGTSGYLIAAAALHPTTILLLWSPIVAVRFFGISRSVFRYFERLVSHDLTFRILASVRVWYYSQLERSNKSLLARHRSADLLTAAVSDVESLQNLYLRVLAPPLVAVFVGITSICLIARYSGEAATLFGISYILTGGVIPLVTLVAGNRAGRRQVLLRSQLQASLGDAVFGLTELLADGREGETEKALMEQQRQLSAAYQQSRIIESISAGTFVWLTNTSVFVTFLVLIPRVTSGLVEGVQIPSLLFIVLASFEAVMPLPAAAQAMSETVTAAHRVRATTVVTDEGPGREGSEATPAPFFEPVTLVADDSMKSEVHLFDPTAQARHSPTAPLLQVRNLCVRYPSQTTPALREVNLDLYPGQVTAVIGESGSGKSTLFNAFLSLCSYQGTILVDHRDTRKMTEEETRRLFAPVTQNAYLFHVSVGDNLRLASPGANDEDLMAALQVAQLDDFVRGLPLGFDTIVGEDGTRFSGGERQRFALARAILRDAPILLLDEPTNGLDPQTAADFLEALWKAKGNRAVLLVTHQLVGLDRVDEIVVLDKGRVVERGTFARLLQQPGSRLRQLVELERSRLSLA